MSRNNKYSKEFKLDCVKRILSGKDTTVSLKNKYHITRSVFVKWVRLYNIFGEGAFDKRQHNESYSKELKESLISDYLTGNYSLSDLQIKYKLTSESIVYNWILAYNQVKEIEGYNPEPGAYNMKSRKTTLEERIEIVQYVLIHENDYKGAAIKYTVPYASVYNWVKKYNEFGIDGISDHRGRSSLAAKEQKTLTKEELQQIKIEELERKLEYKDKVIEVLKKKNEIQEKLERNSR